MRKKEIPEMMVKAVMIIKKATTKIKVGSDYSDELLVTVGVHQRSVLSSFLFATVFYVVTERVKSGLFYKIFYADNLALMSISISVIQKKFANRKDSLESKGLKINNQRIKLIVGGSKSKLPISKINPCGVCGKIVTTRILCSV